MRRMEFRTRRKEATCGVRNELLKRCCCVATRVATQAVSTIPSRHVANCSPDEMNSSGLWRVTPNPSLVRFGTVRPIRSR